MGLTPQGAFFPGRCSRGPLNKRCVRGSGPLFRPLALPEPPAHVLWLKRSCPLDPPGQPALLRHDSHVVVPGREGGDRGS